MRSSSYSPQEAAAVSGVPLTAIQKAVTTGRIPARSIGRTKRRQLDETALVAYALIAALPAELRLSVGAAYQLLRGRPSRNGGDELVIGDIVHIDVGKALTAARRCLALYDRARQIIVKNPTIMGGTPTIGGTCITATSILGRLESGDSIESVLEDYPYLDRDLVEAAALSAKANPPRGRPGGKLWRGTS